MSKELIEKLTNHAEKLLEFVEKTSEASLDFGKEQVPLVIKEVLEWGFYSNTLYGILNLFLIEELHKLVK